MAAAGPAIRRRARRARTRRARGAERLAVLPGQNCLRESRLTADLFVLTVNDTTQQLPGSTIFVLSNAKARPQQLATVS